MARDKSIYTTAIAISPEDKKRVQLLKVELKMQTDAGTLSKIIKAGITKVLEEHENI